MSDIKSGIQYMFQTRNSMTFAVSGTGHTAMECAIFNAVEAGDSVLMAVNGIWGERAADMAERIGKPGGGRGRPKPTRVFRARLQQQGGATVNKLHFLKMKDANDEAESHKTQKNPDELMLNWNNHWISRLNPTGARVNTIVVPPGGIFTNKEIEQVTTRLSR